MCGTTSPTQPTMPQTATLAAVASVAVAITIARKRVDVHAERVRLVLGQREQIDAPGQAASSAIAIRIAGATIATCRHVEAARLPISQNVIAGNWL